MNRSLALKLFLGFEVLVWLPYGLYLVFAPGFLAEAAGVVGSTPTGTTELRAMYGGLQAAIGALCAAALVRADFVRPALLMLCFLSIGLGGVRTLGFFMDGGLSGYTIGGLIFEYFNAACAVALVRSGAGSE